jgi:hypothetical protein
VFVIGIDYKEGDNEGLAGAKTRAEVLNVLSRIERTTYIGGSRNPGSIYNVFKDTKYDPPFWYTPMTLQGAKVRFLLISPWFCRDSCVIAAGLCDCCGVFGGLGAILAYAGDVVFYLGWFDWTIPSQLGSIGRSCISFFVTIYSNDDKDFKEKAVALKSAIERKIELASKLTPICTCHEKRTVCVNKLDISLHMFDTMDEESIMRICKTHFNVREAGVYEDEDFGSIFGTRVDEIARAKALFF